MVLAIVVLALALFDRGLTMPPPVSHAVMIAIALVLLVLALVILLMSTRPSQRLVSAVALANVSSAFIVAFWLAAGWQRFSTGGRFLVSVTVAGLLLVALVELLVIPSRT